MSYASLAEMKASFPERDLVQLTNEDPAATTVEPLFIQRHLDDATLIIDAYLESRFTLPFPDGKVPAILGILCRDLAMYRMQALRPLHDIEDARKRHDDAIKTLDKIREGKLTLGLDPTAAEPEIANPTVQTTRPGDVTFPPASPPNLSRVFDRARMRGF